MANINELKKTVNDEKFHIVDEMDMHDLENYITAISHDYYIYYINNDADKFNAASSMLEYIKKESKRDNVTNYINYSMLVAIHVLLNRLIDRNMDLMLPDTVHLISNDHDKNDAVVNLLERVKQKRKELKELKEDSNEYFKNLEVDMMAEGDYVKHLIRPDIPAEYVEDHLEIIKNILTDEGMKVIKHYVEGND